MAGSIGLKKIGYVVPTRGENITGLNESLRSIRRNGPEIRIVVISPSNQDVMKVCKDFNAELEIESSNGVYAAINQGVRRLSDTCEFFGFLGDDDLLFEYSVRNILISFSDESTGVVYGQVVYVDELGNLQFVNPAYKVAPRLLNWGPCLVPNIGTLIRIKLWIDCGGYDESLKYAGDLDFWIKLSKLTKFKAIKYPIGTFCFDSNGLTGGQLKESIKEASLVRRKHTPVYLRWFRNIYEPALMRISEFLRAYKRTKQGSGIYDPKF
jgi:hypothetical protein